MYTLSYSTTTAARAMHAPVPFYLAYLSGADANRVNGRACEKEGGRGAREESTNQPTLHLSLDSLHVYQVSKRGNPACPPAVV